MRSFLRYPGNKKRLSPTINQYIPKSDFWEPFVGGGSLLLSVADKYPSVQLYANDTNPGVVDLWDILSDPDDKRLQALVNKIMHTKNVDLDMWQEIKASPPSAYRFIFLNLTSYNGYIHDKTGPIGGMSQEGKKWKVDCLWRPEKYIYYLASYHKLLAGRLTAKCEDMFDSVLWDNTVFIYLDPPYYEQGKSLYQEFGDFDHARLADRLHSTNNHWILSYDIHPKIKELYSDCNIMEVSGFSGAKHEEQMEYLISNREFESDQNQLF